MNAAKETGWSEADYPNRLSDKILKLKYYLPTHLVENRKIYGVMRKGIHELPEKICHEIFPIVRVGIELILDRKIEQRERKKKETASLIERLSVQLVED